MKTLVVPVCLVILLVLQSSCRVVRKNSREKNFQYENFKASFVPAPASVTDTSNVFDVLDIPSENDSLLTWFHRIDSLWKNDLIDLKKVNTADKASKKMIKEEMNIVNRNIKSLTSFLKNKTKGTKSNCREKDCPLLAEVVKSKQIMYLYIGGQIKDSFAVSTGIYGRETPDMNVRASGPVFIKYTSTKYPEGDYKGLGNMPYAVFVKGAYAIHGTTQGNFAKLGRPASHGCIRLHPDNAKFFYELVNIVGLNNTWVVVR
jgi:hypothetical protein